MDLQFRTCRLASCTVTVSAAPPPGAVFLATVIVAGPLVLLAKLTSPLYTAVMLWLPALSRVVVNVATPSADNVPVPSNTDPLKKLTAPVAPVVTFAVKVTGSPYCVEAGFAASVTAVGGNNNDQVPGNECDGVVRRRQASDRNVIGSGMLPAVVE